MSLIEPLLLINGPDVVIVYWAPDGSCDIYCTGWVLDKAPYTKEAMSVFFLSYGSR